jgi:hypothetical protein
MKLCGGNEATTEAILASESIPLTSEQVAALTSELAKPKYSGLTTAEVLVALRDPQVVEVAEAVVWRSFTGRELKQWLSDYINGLSVGTAGATAGVRQKWLVVLGAQLSKVLDTDTINTSADQMFQILAAQAVADGIIAQAAVDAFAKRVEPAHNESAPCPLEAMGVFEAGYALEPADVEACR